MLSLVLRLVELLKLQFLAVAQGNAAPGKVPILRTIDGVTDAEVRERFTNYAFPMLAVNGIGYDTDRSPLANARRTVWRLKLRFLQTSQNMKTAMYDENKGLWSIQKKVDDFLHEHPQLALNDTGVVTGMDVISRIATLEMLDMNSGTLAGVGLDCFYTWFTDDIPFASTRQGVQNTLTMGEYNGR